MPKTPLTVGFYPLTADRWADLETLFGARGACGGCWCMAWRLTPAEFRRAKGDGNRAALRDLVEQGEEPGVLAYDGGTPIGWCAVAPREVYVRLDGSRVLCRVDERPVWSISCLFVQKPYRKAGLSVGLITAAAQLAIRHGALIVEAYPHDLGGRTLPAPFVWTGLLPAYLKAGFVEVARRSETRPIVRFWAS